MVHKIKNIETKLPPLGINIKLGGWLTGLAALITLLYVYDVSFSAVVGIYLGYMVLRLVMRCF